MPDKMIIAALFKLINFASIIGIAWVIFRKYCAPVLDKEMSEEVLHKHALRERVVTLERDKSIMDDRIEHDKRYAQVLEKKIEKWTHATKDQQEKEAFEQSIIHDALVKKYQLQAQHVQQYWLYKKVIPKALHQVETQLQEEYASQHDQEQYLDTILRAMKNR
jgi:hypothetical protein